MAGRSALSTGATLAFIMLASSPLLFGTLLRWVVIAKRFPCLERSSTVRVAALCVLGVSLACLLFVLLVIMFAGDFSVSSISQKFELNVEFLQVAATLFVIRAVVPRLATARLRRPLV